jgi:hypothetical protein
MARTTTSKPFQEKVKKCFSALIREKQQNANLTQQKFGADADRGRKHMYQLANGKVLPRLDTLLQLLRVLKDFDAELVKRLMALVFPTAVRKERQIADDTEMPLGEETCPNPECQAVYTLYVRRVPVRETRKFRCVFCKRQIIASWIGTTAFRYRVLQPPPKLR